MCIVPNFVISRKSKNARMGKGKGGFIRWVFRIQKGVVLTEFLGISYYRLIKILSFFRKVFKLKLCLVRNSEKRNTFSIWSKLNTSLIYFDKYRYM
jgi:ribosomal protein L16/L10AE